MVLYASFFSLLLHTYNLASVADETCTTPKQLDTHHVKFAPSPPSRPKKDTMSKVLRETLSA